MEGVGLVSGGVGLVSGGVGLVSGGGRVCKWRGWGL